MVAQLVGIFHSIYRIPRSVTIFTRIGHCSVKKSSPHAPNQEENFGLMVCQTGRWSVQLFCSIAHWEEMLMFHLHLRLCLPSDFRSGFTTNFYIVTNFLSCLSNNNWFWIGWLDLLTASFTITRNHNSLIITDNKSSAEFWSDLLWSLSILKVKVRVTVRLAVYRRSVRLGVSP
jgi:hypothetical protein